MARPLLIDFGISTGTTAVIGRVSRAVDGADYGVVACLATSLLLFAIGDLPISFIMARESYRARRSR